MAETKYGRYICTELAIEAREKIRTQATPRAVEHVVWMDSTVIPGAMYAECVWINPDYKETLAELPAHTHPFDEVLAYFGTDLNDPYDLNGEIELWLEDEKFTLKNSFIAYVPAGMRHCPLKHISQDRRFFHFTLGPGKEYVRDDGTGENTPKPDWDVRKHVITNLKENIEKAPWSGGPQQAGNGRGGRLLYMDSEVAPGAFYLETMWVTPPEGDGIPPGGNPVEAHTHDFDEMLAFFGTDPDDHRNLCGEIELWLGDEKHIIDKSCMVYVPASLKHCPLRFNRVDRPIFYFTTGPGKMYL